MAAFVVNIVLILAVLVLVTAWLIGTARRRRHDRRQHAEDRRLILHAFLHAATPTEAAPKPSEPTVPATPTAAGPVQHLDAASVAALLDLLEDRRPPRRGLFTGLVNGPRGVWTAGARAGQHVASRTRERVGGEEEVSELYRAAAREILDIHAHDPRDAHLEYRRYADALGDPALAELYVRSAAHATYGEPDKVRLVVEQITTARSSPRTGLPHATPTPSA